MKKLLPIILALVGLAGGVAAGHMLRPKADEPAEAAAEHGAAAQDHEKAADSLEEEPAGKPENYDYARLNKQFVVPIIRDSEIASLVVMSLTVEVEPGMSNMVFDREPKLRDAFLQAMFLHAQSGGFNGAFTSGQAMKDLRGALRDAARQVAGPSAHDVLVTDIVRQDLL